MSADQYQWTAVDDYFTGLLRPSDPVLDESLAASAAAGLPAIQVSPLQGRLLRLLAQTQGARSILEIGTLGGYSTIWLARALPVDGRLVTLEYESRHAEVARDNLARAGLADKVEVRSGPRWSPCRSSRPRAAAPSMSSSSTPTSRPIRSTC